VFEETYREADRRVFRVRCGSGTYIRSLIADLGDAYCEELRRTAIGPFELPGTSGAVETQRIDLVDALSTILPILKLDANQSELLAHGRPVDLGDEVPDLAVALGPEGLVAIAGCNENGFLASRVGFVG
jgi:tRNA pseudouridine55 synthase